MTSYLNEIIRKNNMNKLLKQLGPTTWLVDVVPSKKRFVFLFFQNKI